MESTKSILITTLIGFPLQISSSQSFKIQDWKLIASDLAQAPSAILNPKPDPSFL